MTTEHVHTSQGAHASCFSFSSLCLLVQLFSSLCTRYIQSMSSRALPCITSCNAFRSKTMSWVFFFPPDEKRGFDSFSAPRTSHVSVHLSMKLPVLVLAVMPFRKRTVQLSAVQTTYSHSAAPKVLSNSKTDLKNFLSDHARLWICVSACSTTRI